MSSTSDLGIGAGAGARRAEILLAKLPQLQNLVKRDPEAYKDEFLMQHRHFTNEVR